MNFVITDTYRFWWPVTVRIPHPENAGTIIEQTFDAWFAALDEVRANELDEAFAALETDKDRKAHQHDVIREVMKDWRGVIGVDGNEQPFTPEALEQCISQTWFRIGVYEAYAQAMRAEATHDGPSAKN